MPDLPTRPPRRTEETAPFWDACAQRRLVLPRCVTCTQLIWYPRRFCPACGSTDIVWEQMSGNGSVYTFTVVRRGQGPYKDVSPYVLAYVELDEGPRLLTNVVTDDVESIRCGQRVRVRFDAAGDSDAIPRFEPVGTSGNDSV
ncbi:MAG: hypothetical protein RL219_2487 [Actinomycetota bacterium]